MFNNDNLLRAKFNCLYYYQSVVSEPPSPWVKVLIDSFIWDEKQSFYLLLNPLKNLIWEDCIEIAHLVWLNPNNEQIRLVFLFIRYEFDNYVLSSHELNKMAEIRQTDNIFQKITDYLRLKNYALPFMNFSIEEMIEKGWLKLKLE